MNGFTRDAWNKAAIYVSVLIAFQLCPPRARPQSPTSSQADYVRAESLVRSHRWEEGLDILHRLLKADPRNLKALNLAGIASSGRGDSLQADRYFERALRVDPNFLPALKNLSISEFNAHQYSLAEKHLLAAQQQLPDDPTINIYLGDIAYAQQKYSLAAERLNHARQLVSRDGNLTGHLAISLLRTGQKQEALDLLNQTTPSDLNPQSQLAVGVTLAESGSNEQAIPYLAEAFQHNPDSYDIGFDLALVCVHAKQYATAIATLRELIVRAHASSELENLLAEALAANGEIGDAFAAYREAIALDPMDEDNYLDFASLCMDHRAFDDAMKVVTLGLHMHPESEQLTFMRGLIEASQDNFDLAEKDFQQAALLNPQHDLGTVGLGAVYLQHGNSSEAIKVTRAELRQRPDDPSLLYLLGEGLIANGASPGQPAYVEAQEALERSVKLNATLCLPHIALGSIYLREERYNEAAAQFEAARAIDPSENSAYSHLALAYRRLGQPEKAKEVLSALQALLEQERFGARIPSKASLKGEPK
jgi:tetratricopeptide (TPR) repeat protein